MNNSERRLLIFHLKGEKYALKLYDAAEVMEPPPLFPIPKAPLYFLGVMNFHGSLVPILDLAAALFDLGSHPDGGKVVVLGIHEVNLAFWIDAIVDIISEEQVVAEHESFDEMVEKFLVLPDQELRLLSIENLLDRLEQHINS